MKLFFFFCFFILLGLTLTEAQTYAGIPDSSHVLVVYNTQLDTSGYVKDYYQQVRGIPAENILG